MLKETGAQRWVWEEQRDLMAMEFRFKDAQDPRAFVTGHVHLLQVRYYTCVDVKSHVKT